MSERIKVILWGTGGVGGACLKEAIRSSFIEIVGVLVFSEAKDGKDIGELVGLQHQGLRATTDKQAILNLDADCVLHAPKDFADFRSDDEVEEILRRGFNVITSMPYHNLKVRGDEIEKRFEAACQAGGVSLYATGINPGFMMERLALLATGASNDITEVKLEEFLLIGQEPEHTLRAWGFGGDPKDNDAQSIAVQICEQYMKQHIYLVGETLGFPVKEMRYSADWRLAREDVKAPTMVIPKGTTCAVAHVWRAITEGGPDIVYCGNWYFTPEDRPAGVPCEDFYRVTVEGRPSISLGAELKASIKHDLRNFPGDPTDPLFYVAAVTMIQAIPDIVQATPGVKRPEPPSNAYWNKHRTSSLGVVAHD